MIAIQVSLYPIGQKNINTALDAFWKSLENNKISYRINPLSTITWDNNEEKLYNAIYSAYKKAREYGAAVMVSTLVTGDEGHLNELLEFL